MASFQEHCADCIEQLGEPFGRVHNWLDEFFAKMGYDEKHRDIRHHALGVAEVRKMWGDKAARAAVVHIKRDFYGYFPQTPEDVQAWRLGVVHSPEALVAKQVQSDKQQAENEEMRKL